MPELSFSVYCGICGNACCGDTTVNNHNDVTITCSNCQDNITNLEREIDELQGVIDELRSN